MYEYSMNEAVIEMISFKVAAIGLIQHPKLATISETGKQVTETRSVHFAAIGTVPCVVIRRQSMPINVTLDGPMIIEEDGSTTLVEPGAKVTRNEYDILTLELLGYNMSRDGYRDDAYRVFSNVQ